MFTVSGSKGVKGMESRKAEEPYFVGDRTLLNDFWKDVVGLVETNPSGWRVRMECLAWGW